MTDLLPLFPFLLPATLAIWRRKLPRQKPCSPRTLQPPALLPFDPPELDADTFAAIHARDGRLIWRSAALVALDPSPTSAPAVLDLGWLEFIATRDAAAVLVWLTAPGTTSTGITFRAMNHRTGAGHRLRWRKIGLSYGYWLVLSACIGPADLPSHHARTAVDLAPPAE